MKQHIQNWLIAICAVVFLSIDTGCAAADQDPSDVQEPELFAHAIDGQMYVKGVPLDEFIASQPDVVDKQLQHRNGFAWSSDWQNSGVQDSCGHIPGDSGCYGLPPDLGVWVHQGFNSAQTNISQAVVQSINALMIGTSTPQLGYTVTSSLGQSDVYFSASPSGGADFLLWCEVSTTRSVNGGTFKTCDKWRLEYGQKKSTETSQQFSARLTRTGYLVGGYVVGLKPTNCGGRMAISIYGTGIVPGFCSQQEDLLEFFNAWYAPGGYLYGVNAPSGL